MKIKIRSIEKYLPENRIDSATLDKNCNGRLGRIEKNTGVAFRHHANSKESVCEMGATALKRALKTANLEPKDLDLLISCSASFDYPVPHNSVMIKAKITDDSVKFNCFDVDSTCLSFLSALEIAHLYLQSGKHKRIALVCSEIASDALTPKNEKVYGLFGDAAVAMIIESSDFDGYEPIYSDFENYTSGAFYANVKIGGLINRGLNENSSNDGYYFDMDGKNLIRLTQKHIDGFSRKLENAIGKKVNALDYFVTHQTSRFGNEFFVRNFKVDPSKTIETLDKYGNCISASIPLGLEELINSDRDLRNKKVLLLGTGAGLTLGCMVLNF